jgi:hypothetical protein
MKPEKKVFKVFIVSFLFISAFFMLISLGSCNRSRSLNSRRSARESPERDTPKRESPEKESPPQNNSDGLSERKLQELKSIYKDTVSVLYYTDKVIGDMLYWRHETRNSVPVKCGR